MSDTSLTAPAKVHHKVFHYRTRIGWIENRAGMLSSEGKPELRVASPPEFKGEAGVWTPEDLFVAAVNSCTMATFTAFAAKRGLRFVSYESTAEGTLEYAEGGLQFTKVVVRPVIIVEDTRSVEIAMETILDAHEACLITRSVLAEVLLDPVVETFPA